MVSCICLPQNEGGGKGGEEGRFFIPLASMLWETRWSHYSVPMMRSLKKQSPPYSASLHLGV